MDADGTILQTSIEFCYLLLDLQRSFFGTRISMISCNVLVDGPQSIPGTTTLTYIDSCILWYHFAWSAKPGVQYGVHNSVGSWYNVVQFGTYSRTAVLVLLPPAQATACKQPEILMQFRSFQWIPSRHCAIQPSFTPHQHATSMIKQGQECKPGSSNMFQLPTHRIGDELMLKKIKVVKLWNCLFPLFR